TFFDVFNIVFGTSYDMKICTNFHSTHPDRIESNMCIVNYKILRYYINDLITVRYQRFFLHTNQGFDICLTNCIFCVTSYIITSGLSTFDVMASNPNIYIFNLEMWEVSSTVF